MSDLGRTLSAGLVATVLLSGVPLPAATQDRVAVSASMDVLFENDYVRVQWHDVDVGESVSMHSHPPAVVLAFANSSVRFTFPDGTSRLAQATEGRTYWNDAASHVVVNTGTTAVHNLMVELKQPLAGPSESTWSPDLLPLAAAPDQHQVLLDNERVRVFEVASRPGDVAPAHVHRWPSVFITVSPARLAFRDSAGTLVLEQPGVTPGEVLPRVQWFGPSAAPRSVENADSVELRAYRIELKGIAAN
jgi:hypothetical protein